MTESESDLALEVLEFANTRGEAAGIDGLGLAAALMSAAAYKTLAEVDEGERLRPGTADQVAVVFRRAFIDAQDFLRKLSKQVRHG